MIEAQSALSNSFAPFAIHPAVGNQHHSAVMQWAEGLAVEHRASTCCQPYMFGMQHRHDDGCLFRFHHIHGVDGSVGNLLHTKEALLHADILLHQSTLCHFAAYGACASSPVSVGAIPHHLALTLALVLVDIPEDNRSSDRCRELEGLYCSLQRFCRRCNLAEP